MQDRTIGQDPVPMIGLGCMPLGSHYRATNDEDSIRLVHRALELGVTHFDTANSYGWGHNETLLSKALAGRRDKVFLASKFGQAVQDGERIISGEPSFVRESCEQSLSRLQVDHLDLFYVHRIDVTVPIEETIGALAELVTEGKIRYIGMSEAAPATIRRANSVHQIAALQTEYALWTRFAEDEAFDLCEELGIAFVAYAPLGRGFLTGEIKATGDLDESDRRHNNPRFTKENISHNAALLQVVRDVALTHGRSPAQVALAWVLAQRDFIHAIPGTTRETHLEENVAASDLVLSKEELERLSAAFAPEKIAGLRYRSGPLSKVQV